MTVSLLTRALTSPSAKNLSWLVGDRSVRLIVAVLMGGWTARYLSVEDYGILNYGIAIIQILTAIAPLGMEGLAVREMIKTPDLVSKWLGTVIGFRLITSASVAALAVGLVGLLRPGQSRENLVLALLSLGLIGQSLESGELLFQSRASLYKIIPARTTLFIVSTLVKILSIISGCSMPWFAGLTAIEQCLGGIITLVIARKELGAGRKMTFSAQNGLILLRSSWPLALSTLAIMLYLKMAQLMLKNSLGYVPLGVYSAGIRISDAANFLPTALSTVLLPGLMQRYAQGPEAYRFGMIRYMRISVLMGYAICIPVSLGSPIIVRYLFGPKYLEAIPVLAIHIWSLVFVFLGVARGQHLVTERKTSLSLLFNVIGLIAILLLNLGLIHKFGIIGAATATVAGYAISNLAASFLVPSTRKIGRMQIQALLTPWKVLKQETIKL